MNIGLILCNGFEDIEALATKDILNRAGVNVIIYGDNNIVSSNHNTKIIVDKLIDASILNLDGIILPGGLPGAYNLRDHKELNNYIHKLYENNILITAICAAPIVLKDINEKKTVYPDNEFIDEIKDNYVDEDVVISNNVITAKGPALTFDFAFAILDYFKIEYNNIKKGMLFK